MYGIAAFRNVVFDFLELIVKFLADVAPEAIRVCTCRCYVAALSLGIYYLNALWHCEEIFLSPKERLINKVNDQSTFDLTTFSFTFTRVHN